jgi:hypothetical protein
MCASQYLVLVLPFPDCGDDLIQALVAHHQEPVLVGRVFQDYRCDRSLLLAGRALELQLHQLLFGSLEGFGRARFHSLSF